MKQILQKILAYLARRIITKYEPFVIGITGSVGKTSAKRAIALIAGAKFDTYASDKNFNNEFGLPLSILMSSGVSSPLGWISILIKGFGLAFLPGFSYPQVLVLEMGVDHPGDMDYLLSIVKPDISVITSIGVSHIEHFGTPEAIEIEKGRLAEVLESDGLLVVNGDNPKALRQIEKTKAKTIVYGTTPNAEIRLKRDELSLTPIPSTHIQIQTPRGEIDTYFPAIGNTHNSALLAAVAVAMALDVSMEQIAEVIQQYRPEPGRLSFIPGVHNAWILDDTYNAAPDSMKNALKLLVDLPIKKKIAILGDMLELGDISDNAHAAIGKLAANSDLEYLVILGEQAKLIAQSATENGMNESKVKVFKEMYSLVHFVSNLLDKDTIVLVKASQGMRLEKVTRELMKDPHKAPELLCRQYGKWMN